MKKHVYRAIDEQLVLAATHVAKAQLKLRAVAPSNTFRQKRRVVVQNYDWNWGPVTKEQVASDVTKAAKKATKKTAKKPAAKKPKKPAAKKSASFKKMSPAEAKAFVKDMEAAKKAPGAKAGEF